MKKLEIVGLLANALEMRRHVDEEIRNMEISLNRMITFVRELSDKVALLQRNVVYKKEKGGK